MDTKAYLVPNPLTPCQCVIFDPEVCKGCYTCVNICRTDVMVPNPDKGDPPIVLYPDECWFCGNCVEHCPENGAIRMEHPLNQRIGWKRKDSGELYRVGMKNPPPPNLKPAVGLDRKLK